MVIKKKATKKKPSKKKTAKKKVVRKKAGKKKVSNKKYTPKAQQTEDNLVPLDARETIFVEQYLLTAKPEEAALNAKYSKTVAKTKAYSWVSRSKCPNNKLHVAIAIEKAQKKRADEVGVDATWVLRRLVKEVDADIGDLYYKGGGLKPVHDWPLIWRQGLVSGLDVEQQYTSDGEGGQEPDGVVAKIKLSDRLKRIELIGKHIDIQAFLLKVDHSGEIELADRLQRSRNRVKG